MNSLTPRSALKTLPAEYSEYRGASVPPAPPVQNQAQPVQQNTGRFAEYAAPGPSPIKTPEKVDQARAGELSGGAHGRKKVA